MTVPGGFRDLSRLVSILKALLIGNSVIAAIGLWSGSLELDLLQRMRIGADFTVAEAEASDSRQMWIGILYLLLYIVTAVVFLRWTYLSNRNARALSGNDLRFTPGWAVGWYFIPIATLWKPYQAVKEMFQASHPDFTQDWKQASYPAVLSFWWLFWILSLLAGQAAFRTTLLSETLNEMILASRVMSISDAIDIPLGMLAFFVVSRLSSLQAQKALHVAAVAA